MKEHFIFNVFKRQPVTFVRGKGAYLWDDGGKRYLDFFSGLAVVGLGHSHPGVVSAVGKQLRTLQHVSNLFHLEPQHALAAELSRRTFGGKVFFSNSGAEANECAIKLARRHGERTPVKGKPRYEIITFRRSFHGRTMATVAATGQDKFHKGFGPMLPGFPNADLNDLASVKSAATERTCAVFIEPVQGEGGIHVCDAKFLKALAALCRRNNWLLMYDEVQTGVGRTGTLFAYQNMGGVVPDVLAAAKGLGNGIPIGATLAKNHVADLFGPGDHGSTFGGGAVASAAGLSVLKALDAQTLRRVSALAKLFMRELQTWPGQVPGVRSVRGHGLMLGIDLDRPGADVVPACLKRGLIVNCTAETVIRLLPPFCLTDAEVHRGLSTLRDVLSHV